MFHATIAASNGDGRRGSGGGSGPNVGSGQGGRGRGGGAAAASAGVEEGKQVAGSSEGSRKAGREGQASLWTRSFDHGSPDERPGGTVSGHGPIREGDAAVPTQP